MQNQPTIKTLEEKASLLSQAKKSKENLEKIATLKSQIKQQKELNKLTATKMEIGNLSHLIFFDSTNGYTKLTENSAVIYAGNVAKRIGRRVNLRQDTDNYAKSEFGVVSIKLSDELIEKLLAINIAKDPELSTAHIHAFKLDKPISESYLKSLQNTLKKDSEQINQIIMPGNPIPTLFIYIKELLEICYYNTKNMSEFPRQTFGEEILKIPSEMMTEYLRHADGRITKTEMAKNLYISATKLKRQMKAVEILHLISNRNICRMLERTIAIERLAAKYYKEGNQK